MGSHCKLGSPQDILQPTQHHPSLFTFLTPIHPSSSLWPPITFCRKLSFVSVLAQMMLFLKINFILFYFWLHWVFIAACGLSLVVQWLGLCASTAGDTGSIPGWGNKIPKAVRRSQKKKKRLHLSRHHALYFTCITSFYF